MADKKYILVPKEEITREMADKAVTEFDKKVLYVAPDEKEYYWLSFEVEIPEELKIYSEKTQAQAKLLAKSYENTKGTDHGEDLAG
jgi:hypothetical protein